MSTMFCRVCLIGGDVRLHSIEDIQLLGIYKKITNTKFQLGEGDGLPHTLCYICYRQLQRCKMFSENACRAESILMDMLSRGTQITNDTITALNLSGTQNLSASGARCVSIHDSGDASAEQCHLLSLAGNRLEYYHDRMDDGPSAIVKEEQEAVKEENVTNEAGFIKIEESIRDDGDTSDELKKRNPKGNRINKSISDGLLHCEQCDKKFKNARYLKAHVMTHEMQADGARGPFACVLCARTFHRAANLRKHADAHAHERRYTCAACGKSFKQRSHLAVHARVHTGERLFACEVCGKTFNQLANLNKHSGTHGGTKRFSCSAPACGKSFLQRAQLLAHARTHSGEKPYKCARASCRAAFSHAAPLRRHVRAHELHELHEPARPFACARSRCGAAFSQERDRDEHELQHALRRPHACAECPCRFADARGLRRHSAQVHRAERAHACARCGRTFKRRQHLARHAAAARCRATDAECTFYGPA